VGDRRRSPPRPRAAGDTDARYVRDLDVIRLQILSPPVMLGEQQAMIGRQKQRRVAPQGVSIEVVEQLAEVVIAGSDQRRVIGANLCNLLRRIGHPFIHRPVEHSPGSPSVHTPA